MPKFISIDKTGIAKSHNVEPNYPLLDLYRRIGFKSPESFEQQYVWETATHRIVLLAKTKGRNGQNNTYALPFAWENMPVFYGSIALLNIHENGTYLDLDIHDWNKLCASTTQPVSCEPTRCKESAAFDKRPTMEFEKPGCKESVVFDKPGCKESVVFDKRPTMEFDKPGCKESVVIDKEFPKESPQEDELEKPKRLKSLKSRADKREPENIRSEEPEMAEYVEELEEEDYDTNLTVNSSIIYRTLSVPVVEFRSNICTKLAGILNDDNLALKIEKGVYNYAIREAKFNSIVRKWDNTGFMQLYTDRLRTMFINLQTQPDFASRIKSGELDAETVAYMTHQEMNPVRWKESIERKIKRDDSKFNAKVEASTDMFECRNWKCKSKRCTYYEMQTRSADEPATVFITCLDCGKHWKM